MPHLIVFSHLRWDFVYQRPQHLLTRLAQHYPVIFIEEPKHAEGAPTLRSETQADGVEVIRTTTSVHAPGYHDDQIAVLEPMILQHLRDRGITDYLVWFYTPMALPLLRELQPQAVVYDCMDELSHFKGAPRQMRQREQTLLRTADLVLTGGLSLYEAKRELHPNVHCLPSAVDSRHFDPRSLEQGSAEHRQAERLQAAIAGPRLGFYGVIDERLDLSLIDAVAEAHPEWSVVMVGPVVKIDPQSLPRRPNIHYLGMQSYQQLPHLVAGWDVCLMPFALNEATKFISPTKTLEYMAAEKPVVSTAVKDVVALYGDVVHIGTSPADFVSQCEEALSESPADRARRVTDMLHCVSRFSWDQTATTIHELIEEVLAQGQRRPLAHLLDQEEAAEAERPLVLASVPEGEDTPEVPDAAVLVAAQAQAAKRQANAR